MFCVLYCGASECGAALCCFENYRCHFFPCASATLLSHSPRSLLQRRPRQGSQASMRLKEPPELVLRANPRGCADRKAMWKAPREGGGKRRHVHPLTADTVYLRVASCCVASPPPTHCWVSVLTAWAASSKTTRRIKRLRVAYHGGLYARKPHAGVTGCNITAIKGYRSFQRVVEQGRRRRDPISGLMLSHRSLSNDATCVGWVIIDLKGPLCVKRGMGGASRRQFTLLQWSTDRSICMMWVDNV